MSLAVKMAVAASLGLYFPEIARTTALVLRALAQ